MEMLEGDGEIITLVTPFFLADILTRQLDKTFIYEKSHVPDRLISLRPPSRLLRGLFATICVGMAGVAVAAGEGTEPGDDTMASAFASTVVRIKVPAGEQTVPVSWEYTNRTDNPMMVERFEESCGCLSGQAAKNQDAPEAVAPGATGKIQANFTAGGHRGLLRKSLHVRFVGHDKPVELVVEATIPSHVELSQRELVWKAGESLEAKTIDITSGTGAAFTITSLPGVPENQFTITRETLVAGTSYRLRIVPTAAAAGHHCLQIRTDSQDPRDRVNAIFLNVEATPTSNPGL